MSEIRLDVFGWQEGYRAVASLNQPVNDSGIDHRLLELIKVRASQINGCAYCLDLHYAGALEAGEDPRRLVMLDAWQESDDFSPEEQAVLALTESVTLCADGVDDEVIAEASRHFDRDSLIQLVYAIVTINAWNRLAIVGRVPPGKPRG